MLGRDLGENPKSEYRIPKQVPNYRKRRMIEAGKSFEFSTRVFDIVSSFWLRASNLEGKRSVCRKGRNETGRFHALYQGRWSTLAEVLGQGVGRVGGK